MKNLPTSVSKQSTSLASINQDYVTRLLERMNEVRALAFSQVVSAECPTLITALNTYGQQFLYREIEKMITHMATYTGLLSNFTQNQSFMLAQTLIDIGYYITLAELKYFFKLFEQGKYSRFYGKERPNPQVITESFHEFLHELKEERERVYSQQEADEQRLLNEQARANAVPCPPELQSRLAEFGKKKLGNITPEQTRKNIHDFHQRMRKKHPGGTYGIDFEPQLRVVTPEQQAEIDRKKEQIQLFKQQYDNDNK